MGGGIVPVILHLQFVQFNGLNIIVNILFALNAIIFIFFTIITLLRYIIWPHKWWEMLSNPVHALFIGTFPMGLSTLINLTAFMIVPNTGQRFVNALWAVWWIDAILSAISILLVSFLMMTVHPAEISGVTAAWVLPIVPGIVAAAAGGNVAAVLPSDGDKIITILASYILIGLSFPLGIFVAVVYFQRLVLYKIPPRAAIPSTFLPLGLSAQTSLGLILLGKIARDTFPKVYLPRLIIPLQPIDLNRSTSSVEEYLTQLPMEVQLLAKYGTRVAYSSRSSYGLLPSFGSCGLSLPSALAASLSAWAGGPLLFQLGF